MTRARHRKNPFLGWVGRHATGLMALGLAVLTFLAVFLRAPQVGSTRDEGFYFSAARSYAGWFEELGRDPSRALSEPVIRRHFENNREHPVLVKNLMALSYLALAADTRPAPVSWPPDSSGALSRAMRLPSQVFSALAVALTFLLGASLASRRVGLIAALMFLLAPRHFYHAQLACFDMPAVAVWLATVMAWRKAQGSVGWGIGAGAVWGVALATKHNSFFIPVVLLLHWLATSGREFSLSRRGLHFPRIPIAFVSMLLLGPAIFIGLWPFLWHHTFERLGWYFGFHLHHVNYPWEYFGTLLTDPPLPWLYPFMVTALTFPLPSLALGAFGFIRVAGRLMGRPLRTVGRALGRLSGLRTPADEPAGDEPGLASSDGWLLVLNAAVPFALIAIPTVPIFGGIKHWMHAMPFVCILGALALERMIARLPERIAGLSRTWVHAAVALLALVPSLQGLVHIDGYGTSYYNELAGSVHGAADLGMQRQYWSNNVTGVLPWLNDNLPAGARLYLHEVTGESIRAYKRDGLLRPDLRMGWSPDHADFTVYQYHREFVDAEYRAWNKVGHRRILHGLYIDQVPIVLVYDTSKQVR